MVTQVAFPFRFDARGRTASGDDERHIRDLIEQVLLTAAGERVNRPDFGSGVMQLVFAPASEMLVSTAEYLIQGALQQWLSDRIQVQDVTVTASDGSIEVVVVYINRL